MLILSHFLFLSVYVMKIYSFNYENEGPDVWPIEYDLCSGHKQSPIDIKDWEVKYDRYLSSFTFFNHNNDVIWNTTHNGHTVVLNPLVNDTDSLKFTTDSLEGPFYLVQLHFHWGENDYQGSEHLIDDIKYPLEMHLVHKSKLGDYAVLGFLFKLSHLDIDNDQLDDLLQVVSAEYNSSNSVTAKLKLDDIIPKGVKEGYYYRYIGSLTTPPCTEGIYWTLFETPIEISAKQLDIFHKNSIRKNFRYPQKLYKRDVTSNRRERRRNTEESSTINNRCYNLKCSLKTLWIAISCFLFFLLWHQ